MKRSELCRNSIPRPYDFSLEDLRKATAFYSTRLDEGAKKVTVDDFSQEFKCTQIEARMLRSAAVFHHNLKAKGLA